jgi:lipopolysaccharide export system permease protein
MLSILNKYLLRQNLFLMFIILLSGISIYLVVDLLERINIIVDSGAGFSVALKYFAFKLPLIISQILPAIFMLSVIIQVAIMFYNNEMLAMETNSISFSRPVVFFIVYAFIFFLLLLTFSETMAIRGYQETEKVWNVDIRKRQALQLSIEDLWFKEGQKIIYVGKARPGDGKGEDITIYELRGSDSIRQIIRADTFEAGPGKWVLHHPVVLETHEFRQSAEISMEIEVKADLSSFSIKDSRLPVEALSIITLGNLIQQLKESGSNVEKLATAWHSKIAYAFALVVMTILGLALATVIRNIYVLVTLSLVIVFLYYTVYVFGVSYAEEGIIAPFWGAWLANILFGTLGAGQILWADRN